MKVHEYQAKQLLKSHGIAIPPGGVAASAEEAEAVARTLSGPSWVVKAQIHAGGRGPAGGVKIVHSVDDVRAVAEMMLGATLTTTQTGPGGLTVRRVYIEQGCNIVRSFYLALLVDTSSSKLTLLASPESGEESIEEVATRDPAKVVQVAVDLDTGPSKEQARSLAAVVELSGSHADDFIRYLGILHQAFIDLDATLIEISPMAVTDNGALVALDAKLELDDNALFRHPTIKALRTRETADPTELAAAQQGLNYLRLSGDIGTMVSGAGLAMATLDAIDECGGQPANFLDVPPMSRQAQVAGAVKLLLADTRLSSILVNVFGGGIMRCDVIADGIIAATQDSKLTRPMIVRFDGINAELGRKALQSTGLDITFADNLADSAALAVAAAKGEPATSSNGSLLGSVRKLFSGDSN